MIHAPTLGVLRLSLALVLAAACSAGRPDPGASGVELAERSLAPLAAAPHDVAIVYPLPARGSTDGLLQGSRIVPARALSALGTLVSGEPDDEMRAALRVVAVRLEPCFVAPPPASSACTRQVRFVLQPVVADPSGAEPTTTLDAAVHAIYTLSDDAFETLAREIVAARGDAPMPDVLGVHPVLAREGLAGPFARALEHALTRAVDGGRLSRVTFLGLRGRGNEWQLGGVEIADDGAIAPLAIPGSGAKLQSLVLQRGGESFSKFLSPAATERDVALLYDSDAARAATPAELTAALAAANRVENPALRSSEDTDCVTCHTVASSRVWAETKLGARVDTDRFAAPAAAPHEAVAEQGVLRALGYFDATPVVSPRALHDTLRAMQSMRGGSPREIPR